MPTSPQASLRPFISSIRWPSPLAMTLFFRERCSRRLFTAIAVSLAGAALLSSGYIRSNGGDATFGIAAAFFSVISYAGYIIGVRKSRAAQVESTTLTLLVMAIGRRAVRSGGHLTSGLHWVDDSAPGAIFSGTGRPLPRPSPTSHS